MSSNFFSDSADSRPPQLASNNPFRRAVSPAAPSPTSPFLDPSPSTNNGRPVSRNPFLDPTNDQPAETSNSDLLISIDDMSSTSKGGGSTSIDDIFNSLSVDTKPMSPLNNPASAGSAVSGDGRPPRPAGAAPGHGRGRGAPPPPLRGKNMPPQLSGNHRPSHSQEESAKNGLASGSRGALGVAGSSTEAARRPSHSRPRRNSESSIAPTDAAAKSASRDVRKREQSERSGSARPRRRNDIIDQMDASSIFGTVFHHDGPFDALNPHRNRKGSRRAPMQAFPKDSLNNSLGGSGPLNARPDHRTFMGQGEDEAFREFSANRPVTAQATDKYPVAPRVDVFNPLQRSSVLHGDQSLGLGTSTFLEGTPATRTAIQRREVEKEKDVQENPLQRKKSLAQRIRGINRVPRDPNAIRAFSTDGGPSSSQSTGGRYNTETNPVDEFDSRRGEDVLFVPRKDSSGFQSPPSPPRGDALERRSTTDGNSGSGPTGESNKKPPTTHETSQPKPSGGLLSRVKSLKGGGRRPAPPPPIARDS